MQHIPHRRDPRNCWSSAELEVSPLQIRLGYELIYQCPQPTPMLLMLNVHPSRAHDLVIPDEITTNPYTPVSSYHDSFGNICSRIVAPPGEITISTDALINDSGLVEAQDRSAIQHEVEDLPSETLVYLLGSRYCETDFLSETAWALFGLAPTGWARVQAICDYVHNHVAFNYQNANSGRTACGAFNQATGVCRDYTHLAITFCRCMNIPARYCTGYLGDIGVPPAGPMDFAAWFEAYLGGRWHTFDPRNNVPRIGRILMATGRDAADVAISNTFGPNLLKSFKVHTDAVTTASA